MFLVNFVICGVPRRGGGGTIRQLQDQRIGAQLLKARFSKHTILGTKKRSERCAGFPFKLSYRNLKLGLKTLTVSERVRSGAWSNFAAVVKVDHAIYV